MGGFTRITRGMAMGVFVLLMLFSGKVLLTPAPSGRPNPSSSGAATSKIVEQGPVSSDYSNDNSNDDISDLYKLGFNDAKAGLPYGHSLPESTESSSTTTPYVDTNAAADELNFPYQPPPTTTPRSKFDFTTMMALLTLFRTGKQLGTGPDGSLSLELLMANARMMDPMRMGFTGLA